LSPLLARDVEARDLRGQPLGRAASLQSEKSLLGLLSDTSRPGVFRVSEPTLHLALRPDGSNWEDAVAKLYGLPLEALIDMGDFAGGMLKYLRLAEQS
jgi:hypothetical protein